MAGNGGASLKWGMRGVINKKGGHLAAFFVGAERVYS